MVQQNNNNKYEEKTQASLEKKKQQNKCHYKRNKCTSLSLRVSILQKQIIKRFGTGTAKQEHE